MTAIDPEYDRLLREIQPRPPRNREENERLLGEIEKLMLKGEDHLSPAEDGMLGLLFSAVRDYERRAYPRKKSSPGELLEFLMEQNHLAPADLPLSPSRVSEIRAGKRRVSVGQARKLAAFFGISVAAFIGEGNPRSLRERRTPASRAGEK
jgi:HTH-type transcriptional regulator / antitoxin HigA